MRTKISLALSIVLLSGVLAGGCGNDNDGNRMTPDDSVRPLGVGTNGSVERINAEQLAKIAEQVPGVEKADIAMNTIDVLVGVEVDNSGKRRIIEKQVTSALLWQYPEYRYHVTSDETLRSKIKAAGARKKGLQAQMFNQDIKALAHSIDQATLP